MKIKNLKVPKGRWSMITLSKVKKKTDLYFDGVAIGKVKDFDKAVAYLITKYKTQSHTVCPGVYFSCWTEGEKL